MDNWKLPHINSSLNVWGIALWQHTIFTEVSDRTLWSTKIADQQCFSEYTFVKTKETALYLEFYPFSPRFMCEQQEGERLKEADTYTASYRYWLRDVTYHNLDTYQN